MVFVGILLYGLLGGHGGFLTQKPAAVAGPVGERRTEHLAGSVRLAPSAVGLGIGGSVGRSVGLVGTVVGAVRRRRRRSVALAFLSAA